jgi:ribokinase
MSTSAGPIVCVGAHMQCLFMRVERVPSEGETVLGSAYGEPTDGAKASNVAVAAARLGAPVALVTVIGDDERASRWKRFFADEGIDTRFVATRPGPTDVGVVMLPPSMIPAIISVADISQSLTDHVADAAYEALSQASIVIGALESPQSGIARAFEIGKASGAQTLLIPSPAVPLELRLAAVTDILLPNQHEAAVLAGTSEAPETLARRLVETLPACAVLVTAAEDGVHVAEAGALTVHVPAVNVGEVVDTTGAGDAFTAAVSVMLRAGRGVADAARFAVWVAGYSVTKASTMPSYPTRAELSRVLGDLKGFGIDGGVNGGNGLSDEPVVT